MSNKVFNEEWMKAVLNTKDAPDDRSGQQGPQIDWVQYNKGFKRNVLFKLMPANTKEDNVFATLTSTHWLHIGDKTYRFVCPEQTIHLKKHNCKCPICEAKRKLLAMGFKEEELCEQGKFGPVSIFDPKPTTNIKAVVLNSDTKHDWDGAHVSIIQQNGTFLATWLAQKYADKTIPNFTDLESSNLIQFSRQGDKGGWTREISFQVWTPTPDVLEKIKEENEQLTLPDLWKLPSDTDIMQIQQIMDDMVAQYVEAKKTMSESSQTTQAAYQEASIAPTQPVQQVQQAAVNVVYSTNPAQYGQMNVQPQTVVQPSMVQQPQSQVYAQPAQPVQQSYVSPVDNLVNTPISTQSEYDDDSIPF